MMVLIISHFFFTVSNVKGVTINMNTVCSHDTIS